MRVTFCPPSHELSRRRTRALCSVPQPHDRLISARLIVCKFENFSHIPISRTRRQTFWHRSCRVRRGRPETMTTTGLVTGEGTFSLYETLGSRIYPICEG